MNFLFFKQVKHYLRDSYSNILWNVVFNILTVLFGIFSLTSVVPFLQILFGLEKAPEAAPQLNWVEPASLLKNIDYYLASLIKTEGKSQALIYVSIGVVLLFFFKNLFRYLAMVTMTPVRNNIVATLRNQLYEKVLRLPSITFTNQKKGDIISRFSSDVQEVEWGILNMIEVVAREPLTIIFSMLVMYSISAKLVLFALLMMVVTGVIIGGIGKSLKKESVKAQDTLGLMLSNLDETIAGVKIIKAFRAENYLRKQFNSINANYKSLANLMLWRRDLSSPLSEFLGISILCILLWYGSNLVFINQLQPERFIYFLLLFYNIITPAKAFSNALYNIKKGQGAVERINQILDLAEDNNLSEKGEPLQQIQEAIRFENVNFSYSDERPTLQNISFVLPKNKTIALVGNSGSGKSTIADLLLGFLKPHSGQITIDGKPLQHYSAASLRAKTAIVTQEAVLFHDTVYNNIALGQQHFSQEQMTLAAKAANAHDFIAELPLGYQTVIGERGTKLSGGQRQRLTIARAILHNPELVVLDEATSALDSESELVIQQALFKVLENRTALIIAHRLSTIKHADIILVLQDGQIVQQGTHNQLIQQEGMYQKLCQLQNLGDN